MATLRYRFERLGAFRGGLGGQIDAADQEPLASGALAVTGTATSSGAQPVAPALTDGCFVRLVAIDAPLYVDIAASPDPTVEPRLLVLPGATERVHVGSGVKISAILASDVPATAGQSPSADQDPIFDHANGQKTSVTASAVILAPPAGCKYARISTDVDIFVNTAGATAVDDGTSIRIVAGVPEVIPVVAGTTVKALSSSGTATVRCTPLKVR